MPLGVHLSLLFLSCYCSQNQQSLPLLSVAKTSGETAVSISWYHHLTEAIWLHIIIAIIQIVEMLDQENYWIEWLDAIIYYCSQVALVHKYFVANLIKFNEQSWSLTDTASFLPDLV